MSMRRTYIVAVAVLAITWALGPARVSHADEVVVDEFIDIPDDQLEVILTEPAWDYVWIPGSWERGPSTWSWIKGAWKKPPHKKARWVDGHWKYHKAKWHWVSAYWIVASDGYIVEDLITIPATLPEVKPERPSWKHHWVAGYWEWDGCWLWEPGHWTLKPNPKAEWVAGHWDPYGNLGWRWVAGHWNVR